MAVQRDRPYAQFNFLVDLGTGNTDGPQAGFQECSEIGMSVDVTEYRNGNEKENSVRKITGLNKSTDVTLKRGVIGSPPQITHRNERQRPAGNSSRKTCSREGPRNIHVTPYLSMMSAR